MKPLSLFLSICILLLVSETTLAQVAADYYLPLRVGNYLEFQRQGNQPGWDTRITRYTIEGSDSISGQLYFRQKGMEWPSDDPSNINVFHVFWLREDSEGNILSGAMGSTGEYWTSNIDSATVYDPPGPYFPNQFIVPGYSNKYSFWEYSSEDTTMSNTETVQVPAGTFTNCVKSRQIKRYTGSGAVIYIEYNYYAQGTGLVMSAREGEAPNVLVGYNAVTSVEVKDELAGPTGFSLSQNYPNPFNPSTSISFSLPSKSFVSLKVFDLLGQEITTLVSEEMPSGTYTKQWNATITASGVYFCRLHAGSFIETKKLILMR
ncbi:MAG: T9SS type A sorting domain-containing protein [Candidatus Latescibacterota bacterium]